MKSLKLWFKKNLCFTLTESECETLKLEFCSNIYGDSINLLGGRSIWKDSHNNFYICESLINK